jgi:hypothetical protein
MGYKTLSELLEIWTFMLKYSDTASGLEWLDLTLTQGVSAQDVLAGFGGDNIEDRHSTDNIEDRTKYNMINIEDRHSILTT